MKKILFFSLLSLVVLSCNTASEPQVELATVTIPKYADFDTDVEREFLLGAVKELKSTRVLLEPDGKEKWRFIESFSNYNEKGNLLMRSLLNEEGKPQASTQYTYSTEGVRTEALMKDRRTGTTREEYFYNTAGKVEKVLVVTGKTDSSWHLMEYDSLGNLQQNKVLIGKDTLYTAYNYRYNEHKQIMVKDFISMGRVGERYLYHYTNRGQVGSYDVINPYSADRKYAYEYDAFGVRLSEKVFENDTLIESRRFDKYYNPLEITYYAKGLPVRSMKLDYTYDDKNNWTHQHLLVIEGNDSIHMQEDIREIKYFNK